MFPKGFRPKNCKIVTLSYSVQLNYTIPAGTQRQNDVAWTLKRRRNNVFWTSYAGWVKSKNFTFKSSCISYMVSTFAIIWKISKKKPEVINLIWIFLGYFQKNLRDFFDWFISQKTQEAYIEQGDPYKTITKQLNVIYVITQRKIQLLVLILHGSTCSLPGPPTYHLLITSYEI